MTFRLVMVGAGAVGSVFLTELQKRLVALPIQVEVDVYDFDDVEERNLVSQDFYYGDMNGNKAEQLASRLDTVDCTVRAHNLRITRENIMELLTPSNEEEIVVCIDGVDNFETRELLWMACKVKKVPLLHMALSRQGRGYVNWTFGNHDTFHLSPTRLTPDSLVKMRSRKEEPQVPPCELSTFRSLIWNTGYCGVQALQIFLGDDTGRVFNEKVQETFEDAEEMKTWGMMCDFNTTKFGWEIDVENARMGALASPLQIRLQEELDQKTKELVAEATEKFSKTENQ